MLIVTISHWNLYSVRWTVSTSQADSDRDEDVRETETSNEHEDPDNDDAEECEEHSLGSQEEASLHVHLPIPFDQVQNLNHVLPLASTPASGSGSRLSAVRPRGLLPLELEQTTPRVSAISSRIKAARLNRAMEQILITPPRDSSDIDKSLPENREKRGGGKEKEVSSSRDDIV